MGGVSDADYAHHADCGWMPKIGVGDASHNLLARDGVIVMGYSVGLVIALLSFEPTP